MEFSQKKENCADLPLRCFDLWLNFARLSHGFGLETFGDFCTL
jgi:hypothetical protein